MKRRTLLSCVGAGLLVGCLEGTPGDGTPTSTPDGSSEDSATPTAGTPDDEYEQCDRIVVSEPMLTAELADEVRTALEEGEYVAETVKLGQAIDTEQSYVEVDDTDYDPTVESTGDGQRLTLTEVETPRLPEERSVRVSNETSTEREVTVTVDDGDLLDETVRLGENERERFPVTDAFGTYDLRASSGDETESFAWQIGESHFDAEVWYGDDGLSVTQAVADLAPCPWEN